MAVTLWDAACGERVHASRLYMARTNALGPHRFGENRFSDFCISRSQA